MYGTQAEKPSIKVQPLFENDVNMYGTQAYLPPTPENLKFENDVNMYGTQAKGNRGKG